MFSVNFNFQFTQAHLLKVLLWLNPCVCEEKNHWKMLRIWLSCILELRKKQQNILKLCPLLSVVNKIKIFPTCFRFLFVFLDIKRPKNLWKSSLNYFRCNNIYNISCLIHIYWSYGTIILYSPFIQRMSLSFNEKIWCLVIFIIDSNWVLIISVLSFKKYTGLSIEAKFFVPKIFW